MGTRGVSFEVEMKRPHVFFPRPLARDTCKKYVWLLKSILLFPWIFVMIIMFPSMVLMI